MDMVGEVGLARQRMTMFAMRQCGLAWRVGDFWHANAAFEANFWAKWIPPPMKVWIQRETFNATSHPVLDAELSSVSTGW